MFFTVFLPFALILIGELIFNGVNLKSNEKPQEKSDNNRFILLLFLPIIIDVLVSLYAPFFLYTYNKKLKSKKTLSTLIYPCKEKLLLI